MNDEVKWITKNGVHIPITNEYMNNKIKKSVGVHYGDLGKGRDTNFFSINSSNRSTGHFGTGTYFVSEEKANKYGDEWSFLSGERPRKEIDFNEYNLYRPQIDIEAMRLHDGLKAVNYGNYDDYSFRFMKDDLIRNGVSEEKINNARNVVEQKRDEYSQLDVMKQMKVDSLSTTFMKELGFNGIDVRGYEQLDNSQYGSVIYDLDNKRK